MSAFEELGICPEIIQAVEEDDWLLPTPVQQDWTKWSTIQGVIGQVISKLPQREARGQLKITSMITP